MYCMNVYGGWSNETHGANEKICDLELCKSSALERREDHSSEGGESPKGTWLDESDSVGLFNLALQGLPAGGRRGVDREERWSSFRWAEHNLAIRLPRGG